MIPAAPAPPVATEPPRLDEAVARLRDRARDWARAPLPEKAGLARALLAGMHARRRASSPPRATRRGSRATARRPGTSGSPALKSPYFPSHRTLHRLGPRIVEPEGRRLSALPAAFAAALRG